MDWPVFEILDGAGRVGGGAGNSGNLVTLLAVTRKTTGEAADECK